MNAIVTAMLPWRKGLMLDSLNGFIDRWQFRIVFFGFLAVAFGVFVTMPVRMVGLRPMLLFPIGIAVMACTVWLGGRGGIPVSARRWDWLEANSARVCFWAIVVGVVARVAFPILVPPVQMSDSSEYMSLARGILTKGEFEWIVPAGDPNGKHWYAYRPPGFAYFLAAAIAIFGERPLLPAMLNTALFVATSLLLRRMSLRWTSPGAAAATQVLWALWPNGIASVGFSQYEPLFIFLTYLALWLFLTATGAVSHLVAGLVTGVSVLVRQALLPVPPVWLLRRRSPVVLAAVAGLALVVGAWGVRNHRKGIPVLVSSNIGGVIYPAAFDGAKDEYDDTPVIEMFRKADYDEHRQNVMMTELAKQWILANPGRWTILLLRRLPQFLGEDSGGLYWALKVAHKYEGRVYTLLQLIGHSWWVLVWVLAATAVVARRESIRASPDIQFLFWIVLMIVVTALPFLTQPRYHAGLVPTVLMMSGWAFRPPTT
jgi:4-amino-4-deoxy-L-arabinose transferase-like glycosyltransferase